MSEKPPLDRPILDILKERGFIQQISDEPGLKDALEAGPVTFYAGFDPSAECLHVGHLLPIMAMRWLQRAGHRAIVVQGGGTGRIGDPSGKDKTRDMLVEEQIGINLAAQKEIFARFLELGDPTRGIVVDNADWLLEIRYIDFLRDIGKHFSVNRMLASTGAQQRLERDQGYSFVEFNYHLLQSYDFLELYRREGCRLQLGGDDQWFNILGGVDLIRRETGAHSFAFTLPLLLTADGKKMGKTEAGAVWIDERWLPVYDFYQYWVNVDDRDVVRLLKLYTVLPMERIEELSRLEGAGINEAKRVLAYEVTTLVHGEDKAREAAEAARAAFSGGLSDQMPTIEAALPAPIVDLLVAGGLASSKSDARRKIQGGGVRVGDQKVSDINATLDREDVLWAGKKSCVRVRQAG